VLLFPAIICGILGLMRISKKRGYLKGYWLAILGIIMSIYGFSLPILASDIHFAKQIACRSNLSLLGKAMMRYTNDCNAVYPPADKWCDLLSEKFVGNKKLFRCPCSKAKIKMSSYAFNINAAGKKVFEIPPDMVLIFEASTSGWNMVGGKELLTTKNHYGDGCNVLFVDGHVEFIKDPNSLRWTTK
jgi:prepilin-type processing-associated H-X9-DG protein